MTLMNKFMIMTAMVIAAHVPFSEAAFTAVPNHLPKSSKHSYTLNDGQIQKTSSSGKLIKTISEQDGIWTHKYEGAANKVKITELLKSNNGEMNLVIQKNGLEGERYSAKPYLTNDNPKANFKVPKDSKYFGILKSKKEMTRPEWQDTINLAASLKLVQNAVNSDYKKAALIFEMNGVSKKQAQKMAFDLKSNKNFFERNRGAIVWGSVLLGITIPTAIFYAWARENVQESEFSRDQMDLNYEAYDSRQEQLPRIPTTTVN